MGRCWVQRDGRRVGVKREQGSQGRLAGLQATRSLEREKKSAQGGGLGRIRARGGQEWGGVGSSPEGSEISQGGLRRYLSHKVGVDGALTESSAPSVCLFRPPWRLILPVGLWPQMLNPIERRFGRSSQ